VSPIIVRAGVALATVGMLLVARPAASQPAFRHTASRTLVQAQGTIWALAQSKSRIAWLGGTYDCPTADVFEIGERRRLRVPTGTPRREAHSRAGVGCPVVLRKGAIRVFRSYPRVGVGAVDHEGFPAARLSAQRHHN
jgi:hypothetical protein